MIIENGIYFIRKSTLKEYHSFILYNSDHIYFVCGFILALYDHDLKINIYLAFQFKSLTAVNTIRITKSFVFFAKSFSK